MLPTPVLEDGIVRLEPLSIAHAPGIAKAAEGDRESYRYANVPTADTAMVYIESMLAREESGTFAPFALVLASTGELVGHTAYLEPRWWPDGRLLAIEVGGTWLTATAQGTAVNTAAKLLLFRHAFEEWDVARVDVKTDARNARARSGITAVGATFEGVLRSWQPSAVAGEESLPRDTAMYAITAAEWPERKAALGARLAAKGGIG